MSPFCKVKVSPFVGDRLKVGCSRGFGYAVSSPVRQWRSGDYHRGGLSEFDRNADRHALHFDPRPSHPQCRALPTSAHGQHPRLRFSIARDTPRAAVFLPGVPPRAALFLPGVPPRAPPLNAPWHGPARRPAGLRYAGQERRFGDRGLVAYELTWIRIPVSGTNRYPYELQKRCDTHRSAGSARAGLIEVSREGQFHGVLDAEAHVSDPQSQNAAFG